MVVGSVEPKNVRPLFEDLVDLLAATLEPPQHGACDRGSALPARQSGATRCLERVARLRLGQPADASCCWVKLDTSDARDQLCRDAVHILTRLMPVSAHWLAASTRPAWELVCRSAFPSCQTPLPARLRVVLSRCR